MEQKRFQEILAGFVLFTFFTLTESGSISNLYSIWGKYIKDPENDIAPEEAECIGGVLENYGHCIEDDWVGLKKELRLTAFMR